MERIVIFRYTSKRYSEAFEKWRDDGRRNFRAFSTSGATISHHLTVLKNAGLILADKRGKFIYYEISLPVLDEIFEWVSELRGVWGKA